MESMLTEGTQAQPGSRPCRVLMIVTRNQRRGAELFAATLTECLRGQGLEVRLVALCPPADGELASIDTLGDRPFGLRTLRSLRREMGRADVVVAAGSKTLPASVLASLGRPRGLIYQNIGDPLYWARGWRRRLRVRILLRRTSAVAAVSAGAAEALATGLGVPPDRITVLHNARDGARYAPGDAAARSLARDRLGLSREGAVVTLVGALSAEKRIDVAIEAVSLLPTGTLLLVVGEGVQRPALERLAAARAPGRVRFLGSRHDIPTIYAATDVALLTSDSEGVPGVLIEAGLCGIPVVATDVGYVRDVVVPGRTGLLVPPGDARAVAAAVVNVLARRDPLGTNARAHCVEHFDLDRVARRWAGLIGAVGATRSGGARVPVPH